MIGERLPKDFEDIVLAKDGKDFAVAITTSPMFLLVALNNTTPLEINIFRSGEIKIHLSIINEIPFLIVDYGNGLIFDASITKMESEDKYENALNIISLDYGDMKINGIRIFGLNPNFMETLIKYTNKLKSVDDEVLTSMINKIYSTYDMNYMREKSIMVQHFGKIEEDNHVDNR